jgi:cation:H+ antiporter
MVPVALVVVGLLLLVAGAEFLVRGASRLARAVGISPLVVGLTVVACGTSAPELAVNVKAGLSGQADIAVGNIVGSNVFNILAVLGAAGVISGNVTVAPAAMRFDIPVMIAAAVACLPIFFTGGRISRGEGALFAACYVAYVTYLALAASHHDSLPAFSAVMLWFALPATALGVGFSLYHAASGRELET